jgi:hypothetical protein
VKKISALLLIVSVLAALAGCTSGAKLPAVFRERISPTYRAHIVPVEQKAAYEAARTALKKMSYTVTGGGAAQGKLEALGAMQFGGGAGSARQISVSVKLAPAATAGSTEVSVLFSEIREDAFSKREGMGTTTPMANTPLYDVFFSHLDQAVSTRED